MNRFASSLACLCLLAPTLTATSITYVGKETGNAVQNWSNPSVAKIQDLNGDNLFGGAGYYQITPGATGDTWGQAAPAGNDLGISQVYPTQRVQPPFIVADPIGEEGDFINLDGAPFFQNADATGTVRQGALRLNDLNKEPGMVGGLIPGLRSKAFKFTLEKSASFRLGVAVDVLGDAFYAPDYVSVTCSATGEIFSAPLVRDETPDMVFFDIGGIAGNEFTVALWQTDLDLGIDARVALALITFDQLPTPKLSYTRNGNNITLSWEENIDGWILESSIDLGAGDDWDPVPGVDYENNIVTVPMSGVPKNFFRLKKNP